MESELLKIFDEQGSECGAASRSEVHKAGHWHETFHCWFIERTEGEEFIYFQIRSDAKKDYPKLLDITAAGHILASENSLDGLREVKEELGIDISIDELVSLGIVKDSLISPTFIDKELCHVFLYTKHVPFEMFSLQQEEVSGIVKVKVADFEKLWFENGTADIIVEGFRINQGGKKDSARMKVNKTDFVPHEDTYIRTIIESIRKANALIK